MKEATVDNDLLCHRRRAVCRCACRSCWPASRLMATFGHASLLAEGSAGLGDLVALGKTLILAAAEHRGRILGVNLPDHGWHKLEIEKKSRHSRKRGGEKGQSGWNDDGQLRWMTMEIKQGENQNRGMRRLTCGQRRKFFRMRKWNGRPRLL